MPGGYVPPPVVVLPPITGPGGGGSGLGHGGGGTPPGGSTSPGFIPPAEAFTGKRPEDDKDKPVVDEQLPRVDAAIAERRNRTRVAFSTNKPTTGLKI